MIMERERKIVSEALKDKDTIADTTSILKNVVAIYPKSAEASVEARKKGNTLLTQQPKHDAETHKAIFRYYCESIALAPVDSQELAFAYGNRSYFLFHIQKYEDCIKDIDRALKITNSDVLKLKLLGRKLKCLEKLDKLTRPNYSSIVEMILDLDQKLGSQDIVDKVEIIKMASAVKASNVNDTETGEKRNYGDDILVTDNLLSCVSIQYSEKYGRHLIAAKDYKPGDIIFVEKLFASSFNSGSSILECDYCLKSNWSNIPCDCCNWSMYCSEDCKEKAWNEYHEIDCAIISYLKECYEVAWKVNVLIVRILCKAIKETGSIANLKKELELFDHQTGGLSKNLVKHGQFGFNCIQNVYHLASFIPEGGLAMTCIIPMLMICFGKYSKLIDNFHFERHEDLKKYEDLMFLGSLALKIMFIISNNGVASTHNEDTDKQSEISHTDGKRVLSVLFSLLNNSCFPVAAYCYTYQNKMILYALHPIKKNSQIFISYRYLFEEDELSIRQNKFQKKYNFTCHCKACVQKWPTMNTPEEKNKLEADALKDMESNKFCIEEYQEIMNLLHEKRQIKQSHLQKLSSFITIGCRWTQPSSLLCTMTGLLTIMFRQMYAPKTLVFDKCE